jgi:shikimate dehydrogenase
VATHAIEQIVSCMGQPVAGNPTQYMMEKALADAGLDWRYLTLEVAPADLGDAVRGMKAMGFCGGNFTIPHKIAVLDYLDGLSEAAELIGAVNCVYRNAEGGFIGENTDGKGFVQSLSGVIEPKGKQVVVLGAGGAARAIAVELALAGAARVDIVNRSAERGAALVELLSQRVKVASELTEWQGNYSVPEGCDLLVNATSIGLNDPDGLVPIAERALEGKLVVADVVFNPADTLFLQAARIRGCTTIDGLGMLVNQAVIGFQIWTGRKPNAAIMREALEEFLEL